MTTFFTNHPTVYRYLTSSLTTFLTTFLGSLSIQIGSGVGLQWTGAFFLSLIAVAARAAIKSVVESFTPAHADPQA